MFLDQNCLFVTFNKRKRANLKNIPKTILLIYYYCQKSNADGYSGHTRCASLYAYGCALVRRNNILKF